MFSSLKPFTDKRGDEAQVTESWDLAPLPVLCLQSTHLQKDPTNVHSFKDSFLPTGQFPIKPKHQFGDILTCNRKQIMNRDRRVPWKQGFG